MFGNESERISLANETCQSRFDESPLHDKYHKRRSQYLLLVAIMAIFSSLIKWTLRYINKARVCLVCSVFKLEYEMSTHHGRKSTVVDTVPRSTILV